LRAPMRANRIISTVALNPFRMDTQTNWASCYYRVSCGDWQDGSLPFPGISV
jgi:hypothetical protein